MPGFLRIDQIDPVAEGRATEYLKHRRSVLGIVHKFDASMTANTLPLDQIGVHEARRDVPAQDGELGRFQYASANVLHAMTKKLYGAAAFTQTAGADSEYVYLQPFAIPPFGENALDVQSVEELRWLVNWDTSGANWSDIDSAEHRMYAVVADDLPERYILHIDTKDLDFSGAGDREDRVFQSNVAYIAVVDDGSLRDLRVDRDGETILNDIPANNSDLPELQQIFHNVDDTGGTDTDTYILDVMQGRTPISSLANEVSIEGTADSAGDVNLFAFTLDFGNADVERSVSRAASRARTRAQGTQFRGELEGSEFENSGGPPPRTAPQPT